MTDKGQLRQASSADIRKRDYAKIREICRPYRSAIIATNIIGVVMTGLTILQAILLQQILGEINSGQSSDILLNVLIVFGSVAISSLLLWWLDTWTNLIQFRCINKLRELMYRNYLVGGAGADLNSNDILSRIYEEPGSLVRCVAFFKSLMFFFGVQVVAFVVIIFWYTWVVGLVVLVVVPLLMLIVKMLGGKMATAQLAYTRQRASTRGVVMQGVAGLSILNILRKGLYYCGIFRREMAPEYRLYAKQVKVGVASQTLNNAIAGLLPIAFAALTALLYVNSIVDNVGTIVLVYMLTTFLVYPIQNTGQVLQEREVGHKAYTRIAPLMEERIDNFGDKVLDGDIHTVEIDIERYAYDEDKSILQGFGLSLRAGDSVCVVGESGSGKSTLLKLLLNQIHADTARIQINGNNLKDIERESYYRQVGYVQQKSFMFRGSVIDNITLGDSYTQEEIDRVLQECGLREFVDTYGLDKEIDEKNENVSGGQLQRISLARTLIRRPKLILLDEPTASLDSETGVDIVKTLLHRVERDNLILLCVSHDKSVIELFGKKIEIG